MKRHVAATLMGVLGFFIIDSHIDWVRHDNGMLLEVSGQPFDPHGWMAEQWLQLRKDCRLVQNEPTTSATAQAVLQVIQQHSLPDSLESQLLQLQLQADWGLAEVEFKTLNPSIVVLRQVDGHWKIQETAVWSGSTSPWLAADFVRRYLHQQAPQLPQALLDCMPIEASRYAAVTPRPKA
ncbi:hypothetical protein [Limnohabitans parvus]|uniref:Uncharacterized protein n=1 Tax=Limnohabitans parvus II-B4 TaxID=1293052 RepID=A0A315E5L2_9BURK|nr:hypothetical protein [Limnohabitans parvus]PUE53180.1 hypothetical protein B9Z37_08825 [Limnohabitans parvus II-B4]